MQRLINIFNHSFSCAFMFPCCIYILTNQCSLISWQFLFLLINEDKQIHCFELTLNLTSNHNIQVPAFLSCPQNIISSPFILLYCPFFTTLFLQLLWKIKIHTNKNHVFPHTSRVQTIPFIIVKQTNSIKCYMFFYHLVKFFCSFFMCETMTMLLR
jgi:hypothetical protein